MFRTASHPAVWCVCDKHWAHQETRVGGFQQTATLNNLLGLSSGNGIRGSDGVDQNALWIENFVVSESVVMHYDSGL